MRSPKTWYWAVVVVMVIAAIAIAAAVTGGPAILSAQTVEPTVAQGTDTTAAATEVAIQRRFNELRRELLDDRADTINWWLAATAIFLTLFGIVAPIAAYIGFKRIEAEARQNVEQARRSAEEAEKHVEKIRERRKQFEEYLQPIQKPSPQQPITEYIPGYRDIDESVQETRHETTAPQLERAEAAAFSLQREGRIEEAIEKWRSIAIVAEGIDDDLAARAWFFVGHLLQE